MNDIDIPLAGSTADRAHYEFTNSAKREVKEGETFAKKTTEVGVHASFLVNGKHVNLFVPAEQALKMWVNMRDSLRHIVPHLTPEEQTQFAIAIERDKWSHERILGRKSHVAEDLGIEETK